MEEKANCGCEEGKGCGCKEEKDCGCGEGKDCGCESEETKTPVPGKIPVNNFSEVKNVIAVMSGKGGVGKSSVTSLLACGFRKKGFEVGVLDADITGPSLPRMFGVKGLLEATPFGLLPSESSTGIKVMSMNLLMHDEDEPVIWRGPVLSNTVKQFWTEVVWDYLDYLFVDLPPGTGDVPLTVMQSLPLNGLIVVTSPQDLAAMIVKKAVKMANLMNIPIMGLIENMSGAVCPKCGEEFQLFGPGHGREVAEKFNLRFLGSLPVDPELSVLCDEGKIEDYKSDIFTNVIPEILLQ
ncbi:ATPase involved in chromosome partitioning [Pelotomaculum thermopropionicum SI]|uniref:Iron-sulfur cluster carrier protein n=1 Tax=Pelotomaculum thermopropionicum (strain DSM 13744 / JCM 10971 / SI) TaxID=370438 RepID=A5D4Q9_PELTS|nr:ATPase involved in chromosome partitioning [Pelotomaculum thermopropionicum SI]